MRIVGGEWRSRIITLPDRTDLRPTPDRVRETVFNWLGQDLTGQTCLDLFAGSGAMGFEAASRGAAEVVMVESNPQVVNTLKSNIDKLGATQIRLLPMDALKFVVSASQGLDPSRRFDVIFADPPYRLRLFPGLLPKLAPYLAEHGLLYAENDRFFDPGPDWLVWRKGQASSVRYQLLRKNG